MTWYYYMGRETKKGRIGRIGEELAALFLLKQEYRILGRNYRRKWGELDIIAERANVIHFIEVKTISRETLSLSLEGYHAGEVSHETRDIFRPEDNVHARKLKRLSRAIQTYLMDNRVSSETYWVFDLITVILSEKDKQARVKHLEDLPIS